MKKFFTLLLVCSTLFMSCSEDEDDAIPVSTPTVQATFNFTHNWDEIIVEGADMENTDYITANGENVNIGPRFRYLISDVTFTNSNGEIIVTDGYNLVNVADDLNLSYTPQINLPFGDYTVSFTYGFKTEKNIDGQYQDLNSASFGVPEMLGGGYHYMQLDGTYVTNAGDFKGFNYHNIRAVDPDMTNGPSFPEQPTFINVDLATVSIAANTEIEVNMNVAEWFKGPNVWDLNEFDQSLMGNSTAQKMMNENGQNVFSLGEVTQ